MQNDKNILFDRLIKGLEIAFVGEVNAGKSSTINAVCGEKVAEVSVTTGSTPISNSYDLPTLSKAIRIVDTPGLRAPGSDVGLYRGADLAVYFVNSACGWTSNNKKDLFLLREIYNSRIIIVVSKIDTIYPRDDWLKIKNQIERDLGSQKILGISSIPGRLVGIEELKESISRVLEDSQKAFLFNLILRRKYRDCESVIRETMLKVTSLAASGLPIHEVSKFDEEIILMIRKIILTCTHNDNFSRDDFEDAEVKARKFYNKFHKEFGWKFTVVKWGPGVAKMAGTISGSVISLGFGTAGAYAAGVLLQTICYVVCVGMIGFRAKKLYGDNVNVSIDELNNFAKQMVDGIISKENIEIFIRQFTAEI